MQEETQKSFDPCMTTLQGSRFFLAQLYLPKSHASQAAEALSIYRLVLAQFPHALGSLTVKYCIGATV